MAIKYRKGNDWVDLPKSLQPELPEPGTVAEFRFLNPFKNYNQNGGAVDRFPHEVTLPAIFQVQDDKDLKTVGLVGSYDMQGNPRAEEVPQLNFKPQENGGVLYLTPVASDGTIDSDVLDRYYALCLHPQVADNDNKQTTNPVMRKVDSAAEAKKEREARQQKREVMQLAYGLKPADLERAAFLLGKSDIKDEDLLRNAIEKEAETNPKHFLAVMQDENGDLKAAFHKAVSLGVLSIDPTEGKLKYTKNGNAIMDIEGTDQKRIADDYAVYANTDAGKKVHTNVTNLTGMAEKEAAAAAKKA